MLWDPLSAWPRGRRWLWVVLAGLACALQGPDFVKSLRPARDYGADFFQDWASARNFFDHLPIYASQRLAMERYLGLRVGLGGELTVEVNAHPPTSVLLAIPLAGLDYPDAVLAWNLISLASLAMSLGIVGRELGIAFSAWSCFPMVTLLLICNPLRQQVSQGQLNLVLLLLVTGTWAAERSGRPGLAGTLLGVATCIKLFPGFLFLYFAARGRWKVVAAGALSLIAVSGLTAAVLGPGAYLTYVRDVMPRLGRYRDEYANASLTGFWTKLFDPRTVEMQITNIPPFKAQYVVAWIEPLRRSPVLARAGTLISCALIVGALLRAVRRARSQHERDLTFGLSLTAMLLVSPVTWDHYLVFMLIPLATLWASLPKSGVPRILFLGTVLALWLNPALAWDALIPLHLSHRPHPVRIASPLHTLTALSYQCYALLVLFVWIAARSRVRPRSADNRPISTSARLGPWKDDGRDP